MRRPLLALLLGSIACGAGPNPAIPLRAPVGDSPQRGPGDAWVTIVEFADFECPYCRIEEPVLTAVAAAYPDDVRVVFKHFPLPPSIHPHARHAAIAAECAHLQNRFWELHDLLLTTTLDDAMLQADAARAGLDTAAWETCFDTAATSARVDADLALGTSLGIRGTPSLVVNGALIEGAADEPTLRRAVEDARSAAIQSGIPRARYYDAAILGR